LARLWAPWRIKYIKKEKASACIFCRAKKAKEKNYVILKTRYSIAMLNIYPYNNGHIMVAPTRHIKDIAQLKEAELLDLFQTLKNTCKLLEKVLKPKGYNIGLNLSRAAGAGITGHIHIHIVPRWEGDTNFMPVIFNTKIISQSLAELYKQLRNADAKKDKRV
jgi:ATP adenylyltransferase